MNVGQRIRRNATETGQGFDFFRLAIVAFFGAAILEVILIFATGLRQSFTVRQIPATLAALLVGSLGGWLFELFRVMTKATDRTVEIARTLESSVRTLTAKITYQDKALGMLTSCPRHNEALSGLIKASMGENFKNIPMIGVPDYLNFLRKAVDHSDGFEGIQRKPLSWFQETGAGAYLGDIKRRSMDYKKRLLIIDQADERQMELDLADSGTLEYYWTHTGAVTTYWMSSADFKANFPGREIPKDCALYDRQLLIAYEEGAKMLSFDVIDPEHPLYRLFEAVSQLALNSVASLHELPMPT